MAAVKIRVGGKPKGEKPAAKPKPKRPTARSQQKAKTATKRSGPTAREQKASTRGQKAEPTSEAPRRNTTGLAKTDPKLEAKLLKAVKAAGDRRRKAKVEHEESVNALYEVAQEALEAGVSMAKVSDASDISRQWLYKMGDFAGREGGNGGGNGKAKTAPKPAAKRASTGRKSASGGTARSRTTKRGSTKSSGSKSRVKIRS